MPKSRLFQTGAYHEIQGRIVALLNSQPDYLSVRTAESTRAAGDAIQAILSEHFQSVLGQFCAEYSSSFARRAMADLAFKDAEGCYYRVDVKTHRLGAHFSMPNLTSVERLSRFYEDDTNYFVILLVKYGIEGTKVKAIKSIFVPIEFLSWECLTIGALGWGQVQIANANIVKVNEGYPRKKWMIQLCEVMLDFYPREIEKIGERVRFFENLRKEWESRPEV